MRPTLPIFVEFTEVPPPDKINRKGKAVSLDLRNIISVSSRELTQPIEFIDKTKQLLPKIIQSTMIYMIVGPITVEEPYELVMEKIRKAINEHTRT